MALCGSKDIKSARKCHEMVWYDLKYVSKVTDTKGPVILCMAMRKDTECHACWQGWAYFYLSRTKTSQMVANCQVIWGHVMSSQFTVIVTFWNCAPCYKHNTAIYWPVKTLNDLDLMSDIFVPNLLCICLPYKCPRLPLISMSMLELTFSCFHDKLPYFGTS